MSDRLANIENRESPILIYGTAWKEADTQRLTELAVQCGFRAIDTANQRKHYDEAAVGQAIARVVAEGIVRRDELYVQSKFTFLRGQDQRLPYDPKAPIAVQVEQSLASSLEHLQTSHLDAYLLHGPTHASGLTADDWSAWRAIEDLYESGQVRAIGISNVSQSQLMRLFQESRVKPQIVQNRCYAFLGWDREVRQFCTDNGLAYQAFSLLTANHKSLISPELAGIAARHSRTPAQIIFRFALHLGMIPLTGTTHAAHMREDLAIFDFALTPDEIALISSLETGHSL